MDGLLIHKAKSLRINPRILNLALSIDERTPWFKSETNPYIWHKDSKKSDFYFNLQTGNIVQGGNRKVPIPLAITQDVNYKKHIKHEALGGFESNQVYRLQVNDKALEAQNFLVSNFHSHGTLSISRNYKGEWQNLYYRT